MTIRVARMVESLPTSLVREAQRGVPKKSRRGSTFLVRSRMELMNEFADGYCLPAMTLLKW